MSENQSLLDFLEGKESVNRWESRRKSPNAGVPMAYAGDMTGPAQSRALYLYGERVQMHESLWHMQET